jgi:hypothetical protein
MKKFILLAALILPLSIIMGCGNKSTTIDRTLTVQLSKSVLMDKIKGGWAGQTIGCTYGGPTEFRYLGKTIDDTVKIKWPEGYIKWWYEHMPGLYDDVYMDLTFVNVFDRLGLDAPADSFAMAFANAGYMLWHANQSARYNILQGIKPPASGFWKNNPHADDIDYQIEADYAGLMSPGMPNTASSISDSIGHIMNYGDGWYGGVFVGAMYSLAFISNDVEYIVNEALKTIPDSSKFHMCISDIIGWHKSYPDDWRKTWKECENKWGNDIGCPDGVFSFFNIDAVINSAYVTIGLLYGGGDFNKTIDIAARCGQDSDCNPATAGGILGTILGYSKIPAVFVKNLKEVEDMNFAYTNISLSKTYTMSFNQALKVVAANGGRVDADNVTIKQQQPVPVRLEKSFENLYPVNKIEIHKPVDKFTDLTFEGTGIVMTGRIMCRDENYVARLEVYIDGKLTETAVLPSSMRERNNDIFWCYQLPYAKHSISLKWLNPFKEAKIDIGSAIIYSDSPLNKSKTLKTI